MIYQFCIKKCKKKKKVKKNHETKHYSSCRISNLRTTDLIITYQLLVTLPTSLRFDGFFFKIAMY